MGKPLEIVFDHVSFRYAGAKEDTLHDICLTLHAGEKLAVVGKNGAGKTTLVKLMCGLYQPTSGEIRISVKDNKEGMDIENRSVAVSRTPVAARGAEASEKGIVPESTATNRKKFAPESTAVNRKNVASGRTTANRKNIATKSTTVSETPAADENSSTSNHRSVPISHFLRQDYYKLFSVVFQKVNAMFFSLAETVSGCEEEESDLARVEECIRRAGLSEKIDSLPGGIHTKLDKQANENGIELSGGELQKLMLARALYKDAPVLVLDEPTAALDPIAESKIYEEYKNMTVGKSSLFISHRLASTRFCDRILYLEDGKIMEEGDHDSLILAGGEYAKLYEIQSCWYSEEMKELNQMEVCGGR